MLFFRKRRRSVDRPTGALYRQHGGRPWVYGHRGAPRKAPENTLASFALALAQGADGVELDVRACADGLVVFHDRTLERQLGWTDAVAELSLAELAALDLGEGVGAPSLLGALTAVLSAPAARVNVEIKADDPPEPQAQATLARRVCDLIQTLPTVQQERVWISSFACPAVVVAVQRFGAARGALLLAADEARWPSLLPRCGVHPHHRHPDRIAEFLADGRLVNAWTVNRPGKARALSAAGIDGLITDDVPGILRALGAVRGRR